MFLPKRRRRDSGREVPASQAPPASGESTIADQALLAAQVNEAAILRQARHDPEAFAPVYEHYFPRVYAYCLRRAGNRQDAEDLCSQVFTKVLTGLHTYHDAVFVAWLFRIAHNVVYDYYRQDRALISLEDFDIADDDALTDLEHSEEDDREERRILSKLIATLTDEQREMLALSLDAGLNSQQIGVVLGKSPGTVRVGLHRIFKHLRAQYHVQESASNE